MKIRKGDKVRFLDDNDEGIVSAVQDKETVVVTNTDGFDIPVLANELIVIEQAGEEFHEETEEDQIEEKEESKPLNNSFSDVYFAVLHEDAAGNKETAFDLYLINDCDYIISYSISQRQTKNICTLLKNGYLEGNSKVFVGNITTEDLKKKPGIAIQFFYLKKEAFEFIEPVSLVIDIPVDGVISGKSLSESDFFNEKAFVILLENKDRRKMLEESLNSWSDNKNIGEEKNIEKAHPKGRKKNNSIKEVDLHIHELIDDESEMSAHDKINLQIETFRRELDLSIKKQEKRIIFIHGKGNGRLRHEIQSAVERSYPGCSYQDASFKEYGFGATMVIINRY